LQKAMQAARRGGERIKETYARYEKFVPAASFGAGLLYDIITIGRIDQMANLLQQAAFLLLATGLLALEIADTHAPLQVPAKLAKIWHYRDEATHFLLGSLLSSFTIFFFKASSLVGSSLFFVIIIGCLVGNEFSTLRQLGISMRTVLFCVCMTSFLVCVVPIAWGRVGLLPFITALLASAAFGGGLVYLMMRRWQNRDLLIRRVAYPYGGMLATFLILYAFHLIPPVPLSIKHVGIYRSVERVKDGYQVTYARPRWRFWQTGDQTFVARAGDKIYCFFSVFSPSGFKDSVRVRWMYDDPKDGWTGRDTMPVAITGGREQGFRGFAYKGNFKPGDWQVRIETADALEIGRIYLTVETADAAEPAPPLNTQIL
jgi:hypothetical protein